MRSRRLLDWYIDYLLFVAWYAYLDVMLTKLDRAAMMRPSAARSGRHRMHKEELLAILNKTSWFAEWMEEQHQEWLLDMVTDSPSEPVGPTLREPSEQAAEPPAKASSTSKPRKVVSRLKRTTEGSAVPKRDGQLNADERAKINAYLKDKGVLYSGHVRSPSTYVNAEQIADYFANTTG